MCKVHGPTLVRGWLDTDEGSICLLPFTTLFLVLVSWFALLFLFTQSPLLWFSIHCVVQTLFSAIHAMAPTHLEHIERQPQLSISLSLPQINQKGPLDLGV